MKESSKLCIIIICLIVLFLVSCDIHKEEQDTKTTTASTESAEPTKRAASQDKNETDNNEEELVVGSLGEFKLTAYCSCQRCCNEWALNRPVDKDGNEIVYGSTGETLIEGVSIAVDPNVILYGSEVIIDGQTYIAHDTGGAIKGNRIDLYYSSHQDAINHGVKYAEVFLIQEVEK